AAGERGGRRRRHPHDRLGYRPARGLVLRSDVDHPQAPQLVEMGQPATLCHAPILGRVRVRVRLFAAAREAVGADELELELPAGSTAREALARVAADSDAGPVLDPERIAIAVNREYARDDRSLRDGD